MKISAVLLNKNSGIYKNKNNFNRLTLISFFVIVLSFVSGSLICIFSDQSYEELNNSFYEFLNFTAEKSKTEVYSGLLLINLICFILIFFFSTSIIGTPFIYIVTSFRYIGLGLLVTYIYASFGLKGIEYCLLIMLPGKFFMVFADIMLVDLSVYLSKNLKKIKISDKRYLLILLCSCILLLISSAVDTAFISLFGKLFEF